MRFKVTCRDACRLGARAAGHRRDEAPPAPRSVVVGRLATRTINGTRTLTISLTKDARRRMTRRKVHKVKVTLRITATVAGPGRVEQEPGPERQPEALRPAQWRHLIVRTLADLIGCRYPARGVRTARVLRKEPMTSARRTAALVPRGPRGRARAACPPVPRARARPLGGYLSDADTGLPLGGGTVTWNGTTARRPGHDRRHRPLPLRRASTAGTHRHAERHRPGRLGPQTTVDGVTLPADGAGAQNVALHRDWAATAGGASTTTNDESGAAGGCGSAPRVDGDRATGWSASARRAGRRPGGAHRRAARRRSRSARSCLDPTSACGHAGRRRARRLPRRRPPPTAPPGRRPPRARSAPATAARGDRHHPDGATRPASATCGSWRSAPQDAGAGHRRRARAEGLRRRAPTSRRAGTLARRRAAQLRQRRRAPARRVHRPRQHDRCATCGTSTATARGTRQTVAPDRRARLAGRRRPTT